MKNGYVYILTNKRNGTLYTGVTSNIIQRIWQHKNHTLEGFTKKYDITKLVYFENHEDIQEAILREKQIKAWKRHWKLELIENENPKWNDLYNSILD